MSDKTKFIAFMDQLKQKHDKLQQGIVRSKAGGAEQGAYPAASTA